MTTSNERMDRVEATLDRIAAAQAINTTGIAELRIATAENTAGIAELRIATAANTAAIADNIVGIAELKAAIAGNTGGIAELRNAIAEDRVETATLRNAIVTLVQAVSLHQQEFDRVHAEITGLQLENRRMLEELRNRREGEP